MPTPAVTSADLEANRDRWPLFVPEALAAGFRSVTRGRAELGAGPPPSGP